MLRSHVEMGLYDERPSSSSVAQKVQTGQIFTPIAHASSNSAQCYRLQCIVMLLASVWCQVWRDGSQDVLALGMQEGWQNASTHCKLY